MIRLSIVIVNWNTGLMLKKCIDSIEAANKHNLDMLEVVIVDNNSNDKSLDHLYSNSKNNEHEYQSFELKIIINKTNEGFAKACNQGAKYSSGDYILFLNPDMIIYKDTFDNCLSYISNTNTERLGAFGIKLIDDNGNTSRTCSRLPRKRYYLAKCLGINKIIKKWNAFMVEWDHEDSRKVDEVIGAFFMVRKSLFDEMNGFDERFFVYYEEVDFCKRLKDKNYYVYYYAGATAFHEGGGSSNHVKDYRLFYELRSRYQYEQKHFGKSGALITKYIIYMEFVSRYLQLTLMHRRNEIDNLLSAYRMLNAWLKKQ
jgi:N-acetylglucosaminyl-diphospho-decaprenol L-rhamnosyltransferase